MRLSLARGNCWFLPAPGRRLPEELFIFSIPWMVVVLTAAVATAQKPPKPVVEDREIKTEDDVKLKITYFKGNRKKDTPVLVFLHGKGESRHMWNAIAAIYQEQMDFAVV